MSSYSLLPEDWWKQGQNFMESARNTVNRLTNTSPNTLSQLSNEDQVDLQKQWQADPGKTLTIMQDKNVPDYSAKDLATAFNETDPNSLGLGTINPKDTSTETLNKFPGLKGPKGNQVTPSDAGAGAGAGMKAASALLSILAEKANEEKPVKQIAPPTVGQKSDEIASKTIQLGKEEEDWMRRFAGVVG